MKPIVNVHTRIFDAPIEAVRPWIQAAWTGTPRDAMPRFLRTWRKNPPGVAADALIPGQTLVGHGPFTFRLTEWDGQRWRVEVGGGAASGWHGFDLVADGARTRVTHTLELRSFPGGWLGTRVLIPMHDWAVEAMFDRIAQALRTGDMPRHTDRPMPPLTRAMFALGKLGRVG
jgi:hypothetical protein